MNPEKILIKKTTGDGKRRKYAKQTMAEHYSVCYSKPINNLNFYLVCCRDRNLRVLGFKGIRMNSGLEKPFSIQEIIIFDELSAILEI